MVPDPGDTPEFKAFTALMEGQWEARDTMNAEVGHETNKPTMGFTRVLISNTWCRSEGGRHRGEWQECPTQKHMVVPTHA